MKLSSLLLASSSTVLSSPSAVAAYFSPANNAHVEFVSLSSSSETGSSSSGGGGVGEDDAWKTLLQPKLQEKLDQLNYHLSSEEEGEDHGIAAAVALSSTSSGTTTTTTATHTILNLFEEWTRKFDKEYESLYERGNKLLVWAENHVLIERHNTHAKQGLSSFYLGHNEFSDMTHAEFRQQMRLGEFAPELVMEVGDEEELKMKEFNFVLDQADDHSSSFSNLRGPSMETPALVERKLWSSSSLFDDEADAVDWHTKGLMGPIRNQGICGACWAFSAIGSIESAMAINKFNQMTPIEQEDLLLLKNGSDLGLVIPLSEQNLIDCDTRLERGCQGGLMTTTFDEEEGKKGICSEADYPYLATEGTCSASMCTPVSGSIVRDHVDITPRKTHALMEALKVKPVTAAMVATDPMLQFYSSGVYDSDYGKVTKEFGDPKCMILYEGQDVCLPDINHGVLVVGYGKDDTARTNKLFFKIKNSWGDSWGENGYFRLARKETDPTDPLTNWGQCGILTLLSYPVMEGE